VNKSEQAFFVGENMNVTVLLDIGLVFSVCGGPNKWFKLWVKFGTILSAIENGVSVSFTWIASVG